MRRALAQAAFGQVADHDCSFVHETAQGDCALRLREHVAQARHHERLANLVLNGSNRLAAEAVGIPGVLVLPECADDRIAHMVLYELDAKTLVDEQAGEHEQSGTRNVEQGAHRIGENVIEPWPPAVRPHMPERGHHAVGDDGLEIVRHAREGIEPDRPFKIGGVEIDEVIRARAGDMRESSFGEVAMRIEQRQALADHEVLPDQIEEEGAFTGAGLADDVEMTTAFLRIEHDQFARRAGTNIELLVERSHSRKRAGVPCAPQLGKWCGQRSSP